MKNFLSMKKKLICLPLVFTVIVGGMSVNASEIETTDDKVQKITQEILDDENGEMFEDYSFEDLLFVMDNDEKAAGEIFKHFDEIAIPISAPDDQRSTVQKSKTGSTPEHFSVTKDLTDGTVETIYEDFDNIKTKKSQALQTEYVPEGNDSLDLLEPKALESNYWYEYDPQNYASTRSIFKLFISKNKKLYSGSAFRIAANYLATAGHCNYLRDDNGKAIGWADSILCVPAWRASEPYQPYGSAVATKMEAGGNWVKNGSDYYDDGDDWGVIKLNKDINTGYMGRRNVNDSNKLLFTTVRVAGYPGNGSPMALSRGKVQTTGSREVRAAYDSEGG